MKSSITTQTVQKLHISSVTVDLSIIVMIVVGEMFFYFTGTSKRRGEEKGFYGGVVHIQSRQKLRVKLIIRIYVLQIMVTVLLGNSPTLPTIQFPFARTRFQWKLAFINKKNLPMNTRQSKR